MEDYNRLSQEEWAYYFGDDDFVREDEKIEPYDENLAVTMQFDKYSFNSSENWDEAPDE